MTVTTGVDRVQRLPTSVRRLAAAWTLASTADSFILFVLLWIAEPQGWSGVQTAALVVAIRIPTLVGGLAGGRAVDRFGPVQLMLVDGVVRVLLMACLVIAGWSGQLSIWVVLVLGAAAGATAPFSFAAARTLVPRLVEPAALAKANALLGIGDQVPLLLGAALAGPALATLGPGRAFALPLVLLVGVTALAARLPRRTTAGGTETGGTAAGVRPDAEPARGRSSWASVRVAGLIGLSVAYYFTYGPFETVMPHFVRDQLGSGVGGYTLLWVVFGAAALATLPLAPLLGRRRPGLVNASGAVLWGLVTLPLILTDSLPAAAVVFAVSGAVWGPYSAVEATALQRWTSPADHGRVFGTQRALLAIAAPLGAAAGAVAVDRVEPAVVLAASALGCTAAGLLAWAPLRRPN